MPCTFSITYKMRNRLLPLWLPGLLLFFLGYSQTPKECDSLIKVAVTDILNNKKYAPGISLLENIQRTAREKNYTRQYILATNNLGMAYYLMLDYGNAINYYLEAYNVAIEGGDPKDEIMILNNIAILYAADNNLDKAKEYFQKSFDLAVQEKIEDKIGLYASNLAEINFNAGNISEAKKYIDIALKQTSANQSAVLSDSNAYLSALTTQNRILLIEKKYEEVITNCISLLIKTNDRKLHNQQDEVRLLLIQAYIETGNWMEAASHIQTGLNGTSNSAIRSAYFEKKALLGLKTNDINTIYAAKDSLLKLNDDINKTRNTELLENAKLRFELSSSIHELDINKEKSENQKRIYTIITVSLLLVLVALGWAFRKKIQLDKQKMVLSERNLTIRNLELDREKQKSNILDKELKEKELVNALEKEKLKEKEHLLKLEIEKSNRQLSEKVLFQTTRNELIEDIIKTISDIPEIKTDSKLIHSIFNLKNHLKEDTKWDEFTSNFEDVNPEFLNRLRKKHPDLNANDIRFLSFVYLNLSYKEIASLLNISPESCRKRKERISKKLNLTTGKSLFKYLSSL